ncbi:hypothetical protein [Oenococcus sp.]
MNDKDQINVPHTHGINDRHPENKSTKTRVPETSFKVDPNKKETGQDKSN